MADYKEKHLEHFIARNLGALTRAISAQQDSAPFKLLGTQVHCATGIIDMLAWAGNAIFVIELKAETATERTVGQVYRYTCVIEHAMESATTSLLFRVFGIEDVWNVPPVEVQVCPVVVAPSFSRDALRCLYHRGFAVVAQAQGNTFFFSRPEYERLPRPTEQSLMQVLAPAAREIVGGSVGWEISRNWRDRNKHLDQLLQQS